MKVLVTGVPGWLGTRLVEILKQSGRQVRAIVMPSAGSEYLEKLGAEIHRGDLTLPESLHGACIGIETVFHCAGLIHPKRIRDLYKINFKGTGNILTEAVRSGVEKFIYVSSNSVAGINVSRDKLLTESDPPRPYKHYGLSKYKAEQLVNKTFSEGKIKTTIIRPCWFYGVNQPARQTRFFKMIKSGSPIMFGNGKNLRSMSYIDNVIQGLLLAEEKDIAAGKTYWIADRRPYQTIEIYQTIAELLGVKLKPRVIPAFSSALFECIDTLFQSFGMYSQEIHVAGEMAKDIACSIKKAQDELGYDPKVDLKEGMRRSLEWCRAQGADI